MPDRRSSICASRPARWRSSGAPPWGRPRWRSASRPFSPARRLRRDGANRPPRDPVRPRHPPGGPRRGRVARGRQRSGGGLRPAGRRGLGHARRARLPPAADPVRRLGLGAADRRPEASWMGGPRPDAVDPGLRERPPAGRAGRRGVRPRPSARPARNRRRARHGQRRRRPCDRTGGAIRLRGSRGGVADAAPAPVGGRRRLGVRRDRALRRHGARLPGGAALGAVPLGGAPGAEADRPGLGRRGQCGDGGAARVGSAAPPRAAAVVVERRRAPRLLAPRHAGGLGGAAGPGRRGGAGGGAGDREPGPTGAQPRLHGAGRDRRPGGRLRAGLRPVRRPGRTGHRLRAHAPDPRLRVRRARPRRLAVGSDGGGAARAAGATAMAKGASPR